MNRVIKSDLKLPVFASLTSSIAFHILIYCLLLSKMDVKSTDGTLGWNHNLWENKLMIIILGFG